MTDRFEARLDGLFREYSNLGVRPIDRLAVARAVVATPPTADWWRPLALRPLRIALVAVLSLVLVTAGAVLIGQNLNQPEPLPPTSTPPGPTPAGSAPIAEIIDGDFVISHVSGRCIDPDGGITWYGREAASVIDLATGEIRLTVECEQSILLSPDGRNALAADAGKLVRIDPRSGIRTPIPGADGDADLEPLTWSPRGTYFSWVANRSGGQPTQVFVGTFEAPRLTALPAPIGGYFCCTRWALDERRALFQTDDGWAIGNGDGTNLADLPESNARVFAISPDGDRIAISVERTAPGTPAGPGETLAVDVAVGNPAMGYATVTNFLDGVRAIAAEWSPDGATLAVVTTALPVGDGSFDPVGNDLWLFIGDGTATRHPLPPGRHPGTVDSAIKWAPDGARVAVAWHSLERTPEGLEDHFYEFAIVSVSDGRLVSGAGWTPGWIDRVFFSPDGSRVAYGAAASLEVLDLNTSGVSSVPYETFLPEFYPEGWTGQLAWLR